MSRWESAYDSFLKGCALVLDDPRFDLELRAFLGQTYNLKTIADYETGADAKVGNAQAAAAIATAHRFVDFIEASLRSSEPQIKT